MKKATLISLFVFVSFLMGMAQNSNYEKAWEAFKTNDLKTAQTLFEKSAQVDNSHAEAWFMLALIANIYEQEDKTIDYFQTFASKIPDINPYFSSFFYKDVIGFAKESKSDKMVKFMNDMLASGRLNSTNSAYCYEALAYHYQMNKDMNTMDKYLDMVGSISQWQITGTFDNISESGFEKNYPPISEPSSLSTFYNKYQANVEWFKMKGARKGLWNDLTQHFETDNSIMFAQTFIESPVEQELVFRIGTSGSLKTWVNDKLLFEEPNERNNGLDTYQFTVKLNKGYNRVLLQIGSSVISSANFMLRITDKNGILVQNLRVKNDYQVYTKDSSDFRSELIGYFAEDYFIKKTEDESEQLLNYMLLANTYLKNDKNYLAQRVLSKALKLAPECGYIYTQNVETYLRDENRTELSKALEYLKKTDPDNPYSIWMFYYEAMRNEDYDEANKYLKNLENIIGKNESVLYAKMNLLATEEKLEELYNTIEEAYAKYPEDVRFVKQKYHLELNKNSNKKRAEKVLNKFLKVHYNQELRVQQILLEIQNGKVLRGIEDLENLADQEINKFSIYLILGEFYSMARMYERAIEYYDICLDYAPYVNGLYSLKAKCYNQMPGKSYAAKRAYKNAIKYYPSSYDAIKELRELNGKKPVFSYFDEPDLEEIYKNSPGAEAYPGHGAIILHDESQIVLHGKGGCQETHYRLIKVLNNDGIDRFKETKIEYSYFNDLIVEKAEVLKKDGSKIAAEVNYDYIVYTSLDEGDAVLLKYRKDSYKSGKFMKHFTDNQYFEFSYPALRIKYEILADPDIKFEYDMKNGNATPEIEDFGEFVKYTWAVENQKPITTEIDMPSYGECVANLQITTLPNWEFIRDWYLDIAESKSKSDFNVQETAAQLFEGKEDLPQLEKVKIIYYYIINEIRYSSLPFRQNAMIPQKASDVLSSKIGDCKDLSSLFVALCREVDVDANLVLVKVRSKGEFSIPLPSIMFDHCIAKATIDGKEYYLELTDDGLAFAALSSVGNNAIVLDVSKTSGYTEPFLLNPETRVKNIVERKSEVACSDGSIYKSVHTLRTGWAASGMRYYYKNLTEEEIFNEMSRSIHKSGQNTKLHEITFDSTLHIIGDGIHYNYSYEIVDPLINVGGISVFDVPLADPFEKTDFITLESRNFPLMFWYENYDTDEKHEKMSITIPEGKEMVEIPENVSISNQFFDYSLTFSLEENKLNIARKITFKEDIVMPEDYKTFKEALLLVSKSDFSKLAIQSTK